MKISGNYILAVNPDWKQVQLQNVYLECDTSEGPVNITLPEILELDGSNNVIINISDLSGNASVNNITVTPGGDNIIDSATSLVIETDNGAEVLKVVNSNQWMAVSSEAGSGGGGGGSTSIKSVQVLITYPQMLVLQQNPIQIVAPVGPGKIIAPISAIMKYDKGLQNFENSSGNICITPIGLEGPGIFVGDTYKQTSSNINYMTLGTQRLLEGVGLEIGIQDDSGSSPEDGQDGTVTIFMQYAELTF